MCFVPDGDMFEAISEGSASVLTGEIDTFTETGLRLSDGSELTADVIVTATGLNLMALGDIDLTVNGRPFDLAETVGYKGMMHTGVPNMALTPGFPYASPTLNAHLTIDHDG